MITKAPTTTTFTVSTKAFLLALVLAFAGIVLLSQGHAYAHPEDEFCTPGGGMDPEICRALADLDRSTLGPDTPVALADFNRSWTDNLAFYIEQGIRHILPGGLDHILFVLALFFASTRIRPLLLQVSIFTLAHSATLALAALQWVNISGSIVEPLIAASIAFVAVENVVFKDLTRWRPAIVFLFGLLHGLGFAGFFLELGLPADMFWSSLIGFNVGVELGQLSVVLVAFLALYWAFRTNWYRPVVVIPASMGIALFGCWWAVERVFF